ncbi:alcohol dehydrogenase [Paenibacillus sambharensis]|uniref:Alcohol dehydrogenase n=1 Tax=Paenibacillus sambharensis TaxID=1803190 RepID=A0A2W1LXQ1_9BACL|nr:zinc-binding alcohol dehydrogenase family protein [Paenibacillus sambharensis]PZD96287.1 alcohol dehydrogenase [Paenibacillus sambharensis]
MQAIICEKAGRLVNAERPVPVPAAGEALIRIRRIGVCGTDLHAYQGNQPYFTYPRVLGHELAGVVEAVGPDGWDQEGKVMGLDGKQSVLHAGDQVCIIPYLHCGSCMACRSGKMNCCSSMRVMGVHADGGMQERVTVPLTNLIRTSGLTLDQTAVMEPLSIGMHAVRRAALEHGENVLVIGGGPIGLGVMAAARRAGARVIAMDLSMDRLAHCREWAGADETVVAGDDAERRIAELTDGDFPAAVFDATGSRHSMTAAFRYVAHGGRLVYVGLVKGDLTFSDPEFHKREMTLMGSRNATIEDFLLVAETLRTGQADAGSYISHRCPFGEAAEQFQEWTSPASSVLKAMIEL